jgi:probable HAF family extracellular repeat protein
LASKSIEGFSVTLDGRANFAVAMTGFYSAAGWALTRSPAQARRHMLGAVVRALLVVAASVTMAPAQAQAQAPSITVFSYVPGASYGGYGSAAAISADGSTVAGYATSNPSSGPYEAFGWTAASGVVSLGFVSGFTANNYANAVNSNGTAVVGFGDNTTPQLQGFQWTPGGGIVAFPFASGDMDNFATGINSDGSVIVGMRASSASFLQAFRYTAATGQVALGTLPGDSTSAANAVNAAGSVVVGTSNGNGTLTSQAFRWTAATGMVGLGSLPGDTTSAPTGVSGDGNVVVGSSVGQGTITMQAFRWTAAMNTMAGLGTLPNDVSSVADATNQNGSVVVGTSFGASSVYGQQAFIWTPLGGMQSLQTLLASVLPPNGPHGQFHLLAANAISADGTVVAGDGLYADFTNQAWVARLQVADLAATPTAGASPLGVTFHASGFPPPLTYTVAFGDGTSGALTQGGCASTPPAAGHGIQCSGSSSHTYTTAGTYNAALLNASGNTLGTATITVGTTRVVRPPFGSIPPPVSPPVMTAPRMPERRSLDQ